MAPHLASCDSAEGSIVFSASPFTAFTILPTLGSTDFLFGGEGVDLLVGGEAGDELFGGAGTDVLLGDAGDFDKSAGYWDIQTTYLEFTGGDIMDGGTGVDYMFGAFGDDLAYGDVGIDTALLSYTRIGLRDGALLSLENNFEQRFHLTGFGAEDGIASSQTTRISFAIDSSRTLQFEDASSSAERVTSPYGKLDTEETEAVAARQGSNSFGLGLDSSPSPGPSESTEGRDTSGTLEKPVDGECEVPQGEDGEAEAVECVVPEDAPQPQQQPEEEPAPTEQNQSVTAQVLDAADVDGANLSLALGASVSAMRGWRVADSRRDESAETCEGLRVNREALRQLASKHANARFKRWSNGHFESL